MVEAVEALKERAKTGLAVGDKLGSLQACVV
jgi:hypothetical protein